MPELEYFLLAESVSTDSDTKRISIFNVLDEIRFQSSEVIPLLSCISCWISSDAEIREEQESQLRFRFLLPGDTQFPKGNDFRSNMTSESRHQHVILKIGDVPIYEEGELMVELYLNDELVAHHRIELIADA